MTGDAAPSTAELLDSARTWCRADPDPRTRAEVEQVIRRADPVELAALFDGRVEFGTAGLRAPLGPGPRRLNRLVAQQTAAGIARVLLLEGGGTPPAGVVVARDARHDSEQFAADITRLMRGHGIPVHAIDGPAPTPLAAFALRHLGAAAALVVTASHNPARYNGIKVYWSDGVQVGPPRDRRIAEAIAAVARDGEVMADTGVEPAALEHLGTAGANTALVQAYLTEAARLVPGPPSVPITLAVTSLHGVGADLLDRTLGHFGHGPVHHVVDQRDPDPAFPTVAVPNPEEPGALTEVLRLARASGAALAMANDPDADRLALAAPRPCGRWGVLTGDETGAILARRQLELTEGVADRLLVTTVVSSRLLARMAEAAGVHFAETLTGFKWLARPALENPGWVQVLAYEEALGYAVGSRTRDKDGITAALVAADATCALAAVGRSVWDALDDLARVHGAHVTDNGALRLEGDDARARLEDISARVADRPPEQIGGHRVMTADRPAADVQRLHLADGTRVVLRPSGTEAKFKYYCEAIEPVSSRESCDTARSRARVRLETVVGALRALLS